MPEPQPDVARIDPVPFRPSPLARGRTWLRENARRLFWIHSAYALAFGVSVVFLARRGWEHARWVVLSACGAWLLALAFFRAFGRGREVSEGTTRRERVGFFAMTYAMKNLYQGMLFFLLPFYWRSATFPSENAVFVGVLGACALISTLDIVFDRIVFRFRFAASAFHAIALFGCLNLALPAFVRGAHGAWPVAVSAALTTTAFFSLHLRGSMAKDVRVLALGALVLPLATLGAWAARRAVPPVPLSVARAAVGPSVLPDGRLAMEVTSLDRSVLHELRAVTDVASPDDSPGSMVHVWRLEGREVARRPAAGGAAPRGGVYRFSSDLEEAALPSDPKGAWSVDVETDDGRLLGRARFRVE